ncbi:low molecular weight phosphatase family protein [Rossellomorea sp. AcN35-11]|nr:low molecular weight phosphatase family protein [Rossellomorea aquimaris]NMH69622.1 low molecular weight phosphatase family protein [Bacillus sp. RO3]WJV29333.1 low molecular weight phosphatase family protein [Rossellomorea sp. AcN35-11]
MNKTVYFVSSSQQRSLMAEGWAGKLDVSNWSFKSAGWVSGNRAEFSVLAMKELCIDITSLPLSSIEMEELGEASVIVAIQDKEYDDEIEFPSELDEKVIYWDLPNPRKRSKTRIEEWVHYQEICDEIAQRVKELEILLPQLH